MYMKLPSKRYSHTLNFFKKMVSTSATILDVRNPFSEILHRTTTLLMQKNS